MTHDEALEILNDFLSSPERSEDCFDIHQFQGGVVAIESCPVAVSEVEFGFLVLGEEARGANQWFEDKQIRTAWVTCMNETGEALAMDRFTLKDRYAIEASATMPGEALSHWCDGYLQAYLLTEEDWEEAYDFLASEDFSELDEEHMAFLSMLAALADWDQALEDNENPDDLRNSLPLLFATVDESVTRIHRLALLLEDNRMQSETTHETFMRESVKIGRNDPCPCGSGKKYKKCCLN